RGRPRGPSRRCDACLLLFLDLDPRYLQLLAGDDGDVAARALRAPERGLLELPLVATGRAPQRGRDDLELEPRAVADGFARAEPEGELERLRDDLAQAPDPDGDRPDRPPAGVPLDRRDDRARQGELVHQRPRSSSIVSATSSTARSTTASTGSLR